MNSSAGCSFMRYLAIVLVVPMGVCLSEARAASPADARAEVDPERFFPISLSCPVNPADELVLVSANAAGRYTQMAVKGNRIRLSIRKPETGVHFRESYDVAGDDIEQLPREETKALIRKSFAALRDLKKDICDGTKEYFGRYQQMLQENRRITGAKWPVLE